MTKRIEGIKEIAAKYTNFFFDLDGVIWKGAQKIKGAIQTLNYLRQNNKRIFFVTNSSIRNKQMLKERLLQFGFEAELDEIFPSDYITRLYISSNYLHLKKLLVIGSKSLVEQIRKTGKEVVHINELECAEAINVNAEMLKSKFDPQIDGVVMGYDNTLTYNKIVLTSLHVQKGAKFFGTNPDKYTMIADMKVPGCGSMIKCIETASSINAEIAGKPNPFIIQFLINNQNLNPGECLMIGDNLETDIAFGKNGGIDTLCVLTGVSTQEMVKESSTATYYAQYLL